MPRPYRYPAPLSPGSDRPPQPRRRAPRIVTPLRRPGPQNVPAHLRIRPRLQPIAERVLYQPVFPAVKTDYSDPPSRPQTPRRNAQQLRQCPKFVVHQNPQRLKRPRSRMRVQRVAPVAPRQPLRLQHQLHKLPSRRQRRSPPPRHNRRGNQLGIRLIRKIPQGLRKLHRRAPRQPLRRGPPRPIIHPHIQRPIVLVRKPPPRIVDLHARYAQVGKQHINSPQSLALQYLRQPCEVRAMQRNRRAKLRQPRPRPLKLRPVAVQPDQPPPGQNPRQKLPGMTRETQRAVRHQVTRPRLEILHRLRHQHRDMRPRWRPPLGTDVRVHPRILLRLQLLVALVKPPRMRPGITLASSRPAGFFWSGHHPTW